MQNAFYQVEVGRYVPLTQYLSAFLWSARISVMFDGNFGTRLISRYLVGRYEPRYLSTWVSRYLGRYLDGYLIPYHLTYR